MDIGLSTGRTATRYLTACLRASGLDIQHEKLGKDGGIGWPLLSECLAGRCKGARVHLIYRPAVDCMGALHRFSMPMWSGNYHPRWKRGKVRHYYPDFDTGKLVDLRLFMRYWLYINSHALDYADTVLSFELLKTDEGKKTLEEYYGRPVYWGAVDPKGYAFPHPRYSVEDLYLADHKLAEQVMRLDRELFLAQLNPSTPDSLS